MIVVLKLNLFVHEYQFFLKQLGIRRYWFYNDYSIFNSVSVRFVYFSNVFLSIRYTKQNSIYVTGKPHIYSYLLYTFFMNTLLYIRVLLALKICKCPVFLEFSLIYLHLIEVFKVCVYLFYYIILFYDAVFIIMGDQNIVDSLNRPIS